MSTSTADWTHLESSVSISLPADVSNSDLFGGDLFGDELIDMYGSAVADENQVYEKSQVAKVENDDGLGAFRPCTSFNDFAELLPPPTTPTVGTAVEVPVSPATVSMSDSSATLEQPMLSYVAGSSTNDRKKSVVVPSSLLPTGTGVKVNAQAASPKVHTPDPLEASRQTPDQVVSIHKQVPEVSQATITAAAVAAATNAPTAADFTAVAQAAVSNLIMNAGTPVEVELTVSGADVSTAHVTALTSSNWVSAVNNPPPAPLTRSVASSSHSLDSDALPAAKRRRQNLTPDERAKQNRDRNREHARNTRLRKKAYVEELKRTLTELVTQRDANELEQRRVAQRELEQREVRFRVAEEFMKLRGDNQKSTARWAAILEDGFTFTLPLTKYRNMVQSIDGEEQTLRGVEEAKQDAEHLSTFLERLYFPESNAKNIAIIYDCNRKNFFMDGTSAFLNLTASTQFLTESTLPPLTFKGVLRATFSPASNKLLSAELSFDTGAITSQMERIQNLLQVHQGAAAEADAILDSLEMPYFLPTHSVPASITSSEKSDSEDEQH